MDQLPRLGKRELICLLLFTCNYVFSVCRGFLFLWVLEMGYVILLMWHSLSLPYNYFGNMILIGISLYLSEEERYKGTPVTMLDPSIYRAQIINKASTENNSNIRLYKI